MLWKGVKMPVFVRVSRFFSATFFAVLSVFVLFDAHAVDGCPTGYKPQTNVFAAEQKCTHEDGHGYNVTGSGRTVSSIEEGDGTWLSYFPSFIVKGRAYCSTTAPTTPFSPVYCTTIPRRPMAASINTNNTGNYCWCQATEHKSYSYETRSWASSFQKIYANYVYLTDMGKNCASQCASYCSNMNGNLILDGLYHVIGENLRATIFDSLLECIPIENKVIYVDNGIDIDFQYYDGDSVTLKDALEKADFYFKGWCEGNENCANPIEPGTVKSGWTGERRLYAQWERSGCGTGVKAKIVNGVMTCTNECDVGYEKQFNPFSGQYAIPMPDGTPINEVTYCQRTGGVAPVVNGSKWTASGYSAFGYNIKGEAYCSSTKPILTNIVVDEVCHNKLNPMVEDIDTENTGKYCWCKATEFEQVSNRAPLAVGTYQLDSKYVFAQTREQCTPEGCASRCASYIALHPDTQDPYPDFWGSGSESLRVAIYRSPKLCIKGTYTLTFKDGDNIIDFINDYTSTDSVVLPPSPQNKEDFMFVGWCVDSPDCDEPLNGSVSGLAGNRTLYAKWTAITHTIDYLVPGGDSMPSEAPTVYSAEEPVTLEPMLINETTVAEAYIDEEGQEVTTLKGQKRNMTLTVRTASYTPPSGNISGSTGDTPTISWADYTPPTNCNYGYTRNEHGLLDSGRNTPAKLTAFICSDGDNSAITCAPGSIDYTTNCPANDWLPKIKKGTGQIGVWGLLFAESVTGSTVTNPLYRVYGKSSCNKLNGSVPPGAMRYSEKDNETMISTDNSGEHCWCKMTDFESKNSSLSDLDTAWVYLKEFMEDDDYNAAQNCSHSCAEECRDAMRTNPFFRSQVFGVYDACKAETYNIEYVLNGGKWALGITPERQYTIVYQTVNVPDEIEKEHYEFLGWCDDEELTQNCGKNRTIPTGSYGNRTFYAKWLGEPHTISFDHGSVDIGSDFTGNMQPQNVRYGDTNIELSANGFSVTGYEFDGWECFVGDDVNQTVKVLYQGNTGKYIIGKYEYIDNVTCKVKWKTTNYAIIYNFDVSTLGNFPTSYTIEDEGVSIPNPTPENQEQYEFEGWCVTETDVDSCAADELEKDYTIPAHTYGTIYLFAHWKRREYAITYYYDISNYTATPSVELTSAQIEDWELPTNYPFGLITELPDLPKLTGKEHYDFDGWDVYNTNGEKISESSIHAIGNNDTGDKILVGSWVLHDYTIEYYEDFDTNKSPMDTTTYNITDSNIQLSDPEVTPNHYEFRGWYNCTNGTPNISTDEPIEEIITGNGGDYKLCAYWVRVSCEDGNFLENGNCYSCSYYTGGLYAEANGATANGIEACYATCPSTPACPEHSKNCSYDDYVDVENDYINYYHENEEDGILEPCQIVYGCESNYTMTNEGCEPTIFNITYYDGETQITSLEEDYGTYTYSIGLTLPTQEDVAEYYDKKHHTFVGWYDNAILEGEPVTEISTTDSGDKAFYAKWESTNYRIEFYHGIAGDRTEGFSGDMEFQETVNIGGNSNKNINYNDQVKLKQNNFAIQGYHFNNWSCVATDDNGDTQTLTYNDRDEFIYAFSSDMRCTAQWQPNDHELTYDCNGSAIATNQAPVVSVYYDGLYRLDNSICTPRNNYSITSWTCTNSLDTSEPTWNIDDDSTCTANWTEVEYTITYKERNTNLIITGLTPTTYKVSELSNETLLSVPAENPSDKENATFKGWCVGQNDNCTDEQLVTNYIIPVPTGNGSNLVLWAHWRETSCEPNYYLKSDECKPCPNGYISDGGTGLCYYDWSCDNDCPDNATCTLISGQSSGRIYYGSGGTYSCDMTIECNNGYTKSVAEPYVCIANIYNINYYNIDNRDWATGAVHPVSYTAEDSVITISNQVARDWYRFDGWCVDEDNCNDPVQSFVINPSTTLNDVDLYAQWSFTSCPSGYIEQNTSTGKTCIPEYYDIIYMDGDKELTELNDTFTIEDETIHLQSVAKDGYIFDGWCVNTQNCTANNMVRGTINGPWTVGNKTLYAQWTESEFECDSGKFLHIGDDAACLINTKPSSPALAVGKGNKKYYLKMTKKRAGTDGLNMNEDSRKQINVLYKGTLYNVHDDSVE